MNIQRLAVLADYPEEGWPSMDLVAEMLSEELRAKYARVFQAALICPAFKRRFSRVPGIGRMRLAFSADRLVNRFWDYPRYVRGIHAQFDLFHVCDHSYAQLVLALPAERTGVFCHDLDAFRCLLEPNRDPRPWWFQAMARRTLKGFQNAAVVFHTTDQVRDEILGHGLLAPEQLVKAPLGVAAEFAADTPKPGPLTRTRLELTENPFVIHVGSCIPRKRIDLLLDVFAELRGKRPQLRLVKVGGAWTASQQAQIEKLHLAASITKLSGLSRAELAGLYRRAALVLQPSEAEGFGLPVLEALACGSPVLASDIPTLREVGGQAAVFAPVGDLAAWTANAGRMLDHPETAPPFAERLAQAGKFSWSRHAEIILHAYQKILDG